MASFWEEEQRAQLGADRIEALGENLNQRQTAIRSVHPKPAPWLATSGFETGFLVASPLVVTWASLLIHRPEGVSPSKLALVLSTERRLTQSALTGADAARQEVRRMALLLDAGVRAFLASVYASEGNVEEAAALRKTAPVLLAAMLQPCAKVVLGFTEAELRNVARRPPRAQHVFVGALHAASGLCVWMDRAVRSLGAVSKLPPRALSEMVLLCFQLYALARRDLRVQDTLDDYAIALLSLLVAPDSFILSDTLKDAT